MSTLVYTHEMSYTCQASYWSLNISLKEEKEPLPPPPLPFPI